MKKLFLISVLCLIAFICSCTSGEIKPYEDPIAIPYCEEITVDGDISDWDEKGLIIPLISNLYGEVHSVDFAGKLKLAWDEKQLYIMAIIKDDSLFEHTSPLRGDGLEVFISQEKGTSDIIKYIISPGLTEKFSEPRISKYDYIKRDTESDVEDLTVVSLKNEEGYIVELGIPWEGVGIIPASGTKWALNIYLSDVDPGERKTRYALYFNQDNSTNHFAVQQMQLDTLSWEKPIPLMIKAYIEDRSTYKIQIFSNLTSEGKEVRIKDGRGFSKKLILEEINGVSMANLDIPLSSIDSSASFLDVDFDKRYHTSLFFRDFSNRYVNTEKTHRFEDEILFFEELDKLDFPKANSTLFIGSSSIRLWGSTIADDFDGVEVFCRGFGGSTTKDALYFFDRIVTPYKPKSIVIAEGSNDLARRVSPEEVVEDTRKFIEKSAIELPDSKVFIMSIKVSIARKKLVGTVLETNKMLQEMIMEYDNAEYVDVVSDMLAEEGKVRGDIFSSDSLHMNSSGYDMWTRILSPILMY